MATKPAHPSGEWESAGGTFLAWGRRWWREPLRRWDSHASYGTNYWLWWRFWWDPDHPDAYRSYCWSTADVKGASNIPVMLDSAMPWAWLSSFADTSPPECDAIPTATVRKSAGYRNPSCINRHDGYVNGLFMDWSVRKVGLKELWTLKRHRQFNTRNRWTKAGGVKPEDWPKWMRRFKDY